MSDISEHIVPQIIHQAEYTPNNFSEIKGQADIVLEKWSEQELQQLKDNFILNLGVKRKASNLHKSFYEYKGG